MITREQLIAEKRAHGNLTTLIGVYSVIVAVLGWTASAIL